MYYQAGQINRLKVYIKVTVSTDNKKFFYNVYSHKKEEKTRCRYESPTEETREEHG
jgi:hypothetical protein